MRGPDIRVENHRALPDYLAFRRLPASLHGRESRYASSDLHQDLGGLAHPAVVVLDLLANTVAIWNIEGENLAGSRSAGAERLGEVNLLVFCALSFAFH